MNSYLYTAIIDTDRLSKEIKDSEITIVLDNIQSVDNKVSITFKAPLPPSELAMLDIIVSSHVPTPLEYPTIVTIDAPKGVDNKPFIATTPRPFGTVTYTSSQGDNPANPTSVSGGNILQFSHNIGDLHTGALYFDVNAITNKTYVYTGRLDWEGCKLDQVSMTIVPSTTPFTPSANTMFAINSGVIVAAAGNGDIQIDLANAKLVQNVPNEKGVVPMGFWDATFNTSTKKFENIVFNPLGKGEFNIFPYEFPLYQFIPLKVLLGSGHHEIKSHDISRIGHGLRIKIGTNTIGTDHNWYMCITIQLYRERTM